MSDPTRPGHPGDQPAPGQGWPNQPDPNQADPNAGWSGQPAPGGWDTQQSDYPSATQPVSQPPDSSQGAWGAPPPAYQPPPAYPQQPAYPPPVPPKKATNWVAIVVAVLIIGAIAGGFWLFRDRLSGAAADLAVGDCFDEPDVTTNITDVQHQPCADPHDGEVFAVLQYTPDGGSTTYPIIDTFRDYVSDECVDILESYTGRTVDEIFTAGFSFAYLYPSSESWSDGDREITCYITKQDEAKFSGSLRGAGSSPSAT
jgi:hypothetical protein